jgi:hypothetical protein
MPIFDVSRRPVPPLVVLVPVESSHDTGAVGHVKRVATD